MTVRVTDEGIIPKKPKHYTRNVFLIIAIPFGLSLLVCLFMVFSLANFQVTTDLSDEKKASLAKEALMPQIAEYIERYGTWGFQDIDLQIETRTFKNFDELVEVMPFLGSYRNAESDSGFDVKSKSAKVYKIAKVCPRNSRSSDLPLDFSKFDSDENSLMERWTWEYSILEYKDGSCRFVILEKPS